MSTKTTTSVTHYHVQKSRRQKFLEDWRANRRTVVAVEDVALQETGRGSRVGVYVGADGDRQTRTMDALVHEVDPGMATSIHRHSWDAMVLVVGGTGWFEIDGERIDVAAGDSLLLPMWAWHRCGQDASGSAALRYMSFSSEPTLETMRMSVLEDRGDADFSELPQRPPYTEHAEGDDPYARRIRRVARQQSDLRSGRLHTAWDSLELLNTPRGTRTTFLLDKAIGHRTTGITMAMLEFGPGRGQSMHRHPGEAWLYVIEGTGHSYLGTEPEGGQTYSWKKGDLIVVDHFLWHQHFNDDPDNTAKLVRIHIFDSLLETMRVLCDPLVLFEEPPDHIRDQQAGDPSTIQWPPVERPTWP
ncbi:MAG: cupin domain-containing protein [Actinomycetes bacterium]